MTLRETVMCLETEELTATNRESIIGLCVEAHQEEDFKNLFIYIPSGGRHFLAYRGGEPVSHAVVTTRWLQPEGCRVLRTAYVDAVATLPAYQGQGYGTRVMRHLAQNVADYEIGCLETEHAAFFERLGWIRWRGALAGRSEEGLIPTPEQEGIMVLPLEGTPALDPDSMLTIERTPGRIW